MYFHDRAEAGQLLADKLVETYRYENCVVLALCDGGVLVGEQIAARLHATLTYLLVESIDIPGEGETFGTVNQEGGFAYNQSFSTGQQEAYYQEFHGYFEDQKREKFGRIHRLLGDGGLLNADMLRSHTVILVSDGMSSGSTLEAAADYLKPIKLERLIAVTPLASVPAVDRMHILSDEIHVLSVVDNYLETSHYYDNNTLPSHEEIITQLSRNPLNWQ